MTLEDLDEFLESKEMKKVKSMQVQGHIENNIKKNMTISIINFFRRIYGIEEGLKEEYSNKFGFYRWNKRAFDVSNEELQEEIDEAERKREKNKDRKIKY